MKREAMLVMFLVVMAAFVMLTFYYFPLEGWMDKLLIVGSYFLPWLAFSLISGIEEEHTHVLGLIFLLVALSILVYMREQMAYESLNYLSVFKRVAIVHVVLVIGFGIGEMIATQFIDGNKTLLTVLALAGPIAFLVARIFCSPFNGAHNWIGPVMPSEISKISLVAIVPLILGRSHEQVSVEKRNVLLVYFAVFGISAAWASEFGTLSVILVFMILTCFVDKSLNRYVVPGIVGGVIVSGLAYLFSEKVRTRVSLFLEPWEAIMRGDEQSVVNERILRGAQYSGNWGTEFLFEAYQLPPNMSTDYVISTILLDVGLIIVIAILVIYIAILAALSSVKVDGFMEKRVLNGVIIVFLTALLISYAGNLVSLPLTGLSIPFITSVSTIQPNLVFMFLMGLACNLRSRKYRQMSL